MHQHLTFFGHSEKSDEYEETNDPKILGVPYGNRTRVAAVKVKRSIGIQRKPAAWIAP